MERSVRSGRHNRTATMWPHCLLYCLGDDRKTANPDVDGARTAACASDYRPGNECRRFATPAGIPRSGSIATARANTLGALSSFRRNLRKSAPCPFPRSLPFRRSQRHLGAPEPAGANVRPFSLLTEVAEQTARERSLIPAACRPNPHARSRLDDHRTFASASSSVQPAPS
jgi:hypothetical protein